MLRFLSIVLLFASASFAQSERAGLVPSRPDTNPPVPAITTEVRADIMMARKMYREAIDFYLQCPKSAIVMNKIGIAYHQLQDLKSAEKHYRLAMKLNPKYAEAVNNLGTIYYARKNYRRAVGQYEKALQLSPNSASIYSNLGTAQFARKKYDEAMANYQKALEIDPEVFEHRSTSGVLLQERSVEERAKFHYYMAKTYAKAGQNERALLYLRKALEEGWKDREKMASEPEFVALRETPEFQELLTKQFKVL
jgi:tetratricopeptide (TPR) repeat protein